MSAKHTPGPWRVFGYDIGTSPDETLAVVCAMDDNTDDANAALIAAAPDLLAALQECAEYLDRYADVIDGDDGQPEANDALRLLAYVDDIIAAAKGDDQ